MRKGRELARRPRKQISLRRFETFKPVLIFVVTAWWCVSSFPRTTRVNTKKYSLLLSLHDLLMVSAIKCGTGTNYHWATAEQTRDNVLKYLPPQDLLPRNRFVFVVQRDDKSVNWALCDTCSWRKTIGWLRHASQSFSHPDVCWPGTANRDRNTHTHTWTSPYLHPGICHFPSQPEVAVSSVSLSAAVAPSAIKLSNLDIHSDLGNLFGDKNWAITKLLSLNCEGTSRIIAMSNTWECNKAVGTGISRTKPNISTFWKFFNSLPPHMWLETMTGYMARPRMHETAWVARMPFSAGRLNEGDWTCTSLWLDQTYQRPQRQYPRRRYQMLKAVSLAPFKKVYVNMAQGSNRPIVHKDFLCHSSVRMNQGLHPTDGPSMQGQPVPLPTCHPLQMHQAHICGSTTTSNWLGLNRPRILNGLPVCHRSIKRNLIFICMTRNVMQVRITQWFCASHQTEMEILYLISAAHIRQWCNYHNRLPVGHFHNSCCSLPKCSRNVVHSQVVTPALAVKLPSIHKTNGGKKATLPKRMTVETAR